MQGYTGKPYEDAKHDGKPQQIPGRVLCALYDIGGEGVAYHDTTEGNSGSGGLNPADGSYLNEFRMNENVDTSYMKPDFDATEHNLAAPEMGDLYVGWTEPGEWLRYTVEIAKDGLFDIDLFYSAAHGGSVELLVDGVSLGSPIDVKITGHPHHWNEQRLLNAAKLRAGKRILELRTVDVGKMNYAYLTFTDA